MAVVTLTLGAILTATGVIAYLVSDSSSWTALIPSIVGVLLLIAGFVARHDQLRKHAIHGALLIALLGAIGSLRNVIQIGDVFAGEHSAPAAPVVSTIMFVLLVGYLIVGINSFISVRRQRRADSSDGAAADTI